MKKLGFLFAGVVVAGIIAAVAFLSPRASPVTPLGRVAYVETGSKFATPSPTGSIGYGPGMTVTFGSRWEQWSVDGDSQLCVVWLDPGETTSEELLERSPGAGLLDSEGQVHGPSVWGENFLGDPPRRYWFLMYGLEAGKSPRSLRFGDSRPVSLPAPSSERPGPPAMPLGKIVRVESTEKFEVGKGVSPGAVHRFWSVLPLPPQITRAESITHPPFRLWAVYLQPGDPYSSSMSAEEARSWARETVLVDPAGEERPATFWREDVQRRGDGGTVAARVLLFEAPQEYEPRQIRFGDSAPVPLAPSAPAASE
jgi:hypothetical protein